MGLSSLFQRRENWSLTLARRCLKNQEMSRFFPPVTELPQQDLRDRLTFPVGPNTRTLRSYIFRSSFMNYTTNRTERGRLMRRRKRRRGGRSGWGDWRRGSGGGGRAMRAGRGKARYTLCFMLYVPICIRVNFDYMPLLAWGPSQ